MKQIKELFKIERETPRAGPGASNEEKQRSLDLRQKQRQELSKPIVDGLVMWAGENRGRVLPGSMMGKAVAYMFNRWEGLYRFLEDPRTPMGNNAAERALREFAGGHKNYYGSRSKRRTEVAALFWTLFESAKLSGVDPRG